MRMKKITFFLLSLLATTVTFAGVNKPSIQRYNAPLFSNTHNITVVYSIANLRHGTVGHYYKLASEAVITMQLTHTQQLYVQDHSGAILINDAHNFISSTYQRYDGVTGLTGKLIRSNGVLELQLTEDPGRATSSGNVIQPKTITISQYMHNPKAYAAELVAFSRVHFPAGNGTNTFKPGQNYTITDGKASATLQVDFFASNYTNTIIPQGNNVRIVGIASSHQGTGEIYLQDLGSIQRTPQQNNRFRSENIRLYPNPAHNYFSIQMKGNAHVDVFSVLGKRVISRRVNQNNNISIGNLNSGIYLVRITQNGQTITKKLVVK